MLIKYSSLILLMFFAQPLLAAEALPAAPIYEARFNLPEGGKSDLSRLKGKVAVVSFWAAWCPACAKEVPTLMTAYQKYAGRKQAGKGVEFVGIAMEDDPKVVQAFVSRFSVEYPIVYGDLEAAHLMKKLGNWVAWIPYTLVLDRAGKIHAKVRGDMSVEALDQAVTSALAATL
jgi:thiol-disulfide isomerase/thioredoxin